MRKEDEGGGTQMDGGTGEEECDDVQSETCWGKRLEEAAMVGEKILEDGDF